MRKNARRTNLRPRKLDFGDDAAGTEDSGSSGEQQRRDWAAAAGKRFHLLGYTSCALRCLGTDSRGRPLFQVRCKDTICAMFPVGAQLAIVEACAGAPTEFLVAAAFEFGWYENAKAYLERSREQCRSKAKKTGILTCSVDGHI